MIPEDDWAPEEVEVWVRPVPGKPRERQISLNRPEEIEPEDVLEHGYAVDGRRILITVRAGRWTLSDQLRETELELVRFLEKHGYVPVWR